MQDKWQSFLMQQSANIIDGLVADFGDSPAEQDYAAGENIFADLSQLDVIQISGKDASEFLHAQLSSDVAALAEYEFQFSSWCNIKGRVLASFLLYRNHDCFYLLLQKNLTETIIKRLRMFVFRADVSIDNRSDELIRIGIRGELLHKELQQYLDTGSSASTVLSLRLPDLIPRSIILCSLSQATPLWHKFSIQGKPVASAHWTRYDIEAGIAWIGESEGEEFLPQSLNLDLIGGLSFDKGCYPGQEIIARMHFRGKLKQRMFLASARLDTAAAVGTRIYMAGITQHVGTVINAVMTMQQTCLMLVALDLEHAASALQLDSSEGPALAMLNQPYSVNN